MVCWSAFFNKRDLGVDGQQMTLRLSYVPHQNWMELLSHDVAGQSPGLIITDAKKETPLK